STASLATIMAPLCFINLLIGLQLIYSDIFYSSTILLFFLIFIEICYFLRVCYIDIYLLDI
ncbi:MAG: hypothetical protein ACFE75_12500, partial [Candidatus Hodarchaeota archaeon]